MSDQIHGTCVDLNNNGIIIKGPPGSGKSDLALRLIDEGALLVADDRINLRVENNSLLAKAPKTIAGLLEVRELGIFTLKYCHESVIVLIVELILENKQVRLPKKTYAEIKGIRVPKIKLVSFNASASAKVRIALKEINNGIVFKHE